MCLLPALLHHQHGVAQMWRISDRNHQDERTERERL